MNRRAHRSSTTVESKRFPEEQELLIRAVPMSELTGAKSAERSHLDEGLTELAARRSTAKA